MLDEIWDFIVEGFTSVLEFFSTLFDNMGEFSITGLIFGIIGVGFIFMTRKYMLNSFLVHMGPLEAWIWGGLTYLGCFVGGYFIGKHFEHS